MHRIEGGSRGSKGEAEISTSRFVEKSEFRWVAGKVVGGSGFMQKTKREWQSPSVALWR